MEAPGTSPSSPLLQEHIRLGVHSNCWPSQAWMMEEISHQFQLSPSAFAPWPRWLSLTVGSSPHIAVRCSGTFCPLLHPLEMGMPQATFMVAPGIVTDGFSGPHLRAVAPPHDEAAVTYALADGQRLVSVCQCECLASPLPRAFLHSVTSFQLLITGHLL